MPQLSLYLDEPTMSKLRVRAATSHSSLSKYVSSLVKNDVDRGWPVGYFDLYGCLDNADLVEPEDVPFDQVPIRKIL